MYYNNFDIYLLDMLPFTYLFLKIKKIFKALT